MPTGKIDSLLKKITLILISIVSVFIILVIGCFYYSKSQLQLGLIVTNEYVANAFNDAEKRKKLNIPNDVKLKHIETDMVDFGLWGGEVIYPCEPQGHVYVTFNAQKGVFMFPMFNRKKDFNVEMSEYNPKNVEVLNPASSSR